LDQTKLIIELVRKIENLNFRIQQLEIAEQENKILRKRISELEQENSELKSRLNTNSRNSSKPPSSDGYQKKPALTKQIKGKQGGQKGHQGRTLHQSEHPDKIINCKPDNCSCGHKFSDDPIKQCEKRQVFDLPEPRLEVTEYQIHKATCPVCGKLCMGTAPEGVNAPVQYGNGVKAYVVLLNAHFNLPFKKIQLLFSDLFGYPINESTIFSAGEQCYKNLQESETIIKSKISESQVAHADETGLRVKGKLHWLHTATTLLYTYLFVHEKRGMEALESEKSILDNFTGWLVHDCWSSYFKFGKIKHAICGAHILRELEGLIDAKKSKWPKIFKAFLMSIFEMPFQDRITRKQQIISRYDLICAIAEKSEPAPLKTQGKKGKYKRTKGRNLIERLIKEKDAMLAFAFNQNVPFTNNLAERDIRPTKIKLKISNCFRTMTGAEIYARIQSFVSTARKQNRNVFTELSATFAGQNFITGEHPAK
jgi:transposase